MSTRVIRGDVLSFCKHYHGPKFHSLLCDPPYHLTSIVKRFGAEGAAPAQFGKDGAFARASAGFMNAKWDGGDTSFDPAMWAALGQHLYDGAFGMAFASSRGWHRLAVAIEDAGFVIHPSIFGWGFGNGFPKATRVPDERFDGHRYGLQTMKPALEPIIVFQKPYVGRPRDNIASTGAGTLNIDAARIPTSDALGGGGIQTSVAAGWDRPYRHDPERSKKFEQATKDKVSRAEDMGRWPANLVLVHDPACTDGQCVPECAVRRLGEQSGDMGNNYRSNRSLHADGKNSMFGLSAGGTAPDDSGSASRYFYNADWHYEVAEQLADADPVRYEAKASTAERNRGLDALPAQTVGDGRQTPIDNAYQRGKTERHNTHPTVKPIGLTQWLAKLLLPPDAYAPRRILIPFSGSGSELIGAFLAGWDEIVGVELGAEYVDIARRRLSYYTDPLASMKDSSAAQGGSAAQLKMFED